MTEFIAVLQTEKQLGEVRMNPTTIAYGSIIRTTNVSKRTEWTSWLIISSCDDGEQTK